MNHYEHQKTRIQSLKDQALDMLDEIRNEYHVSDGTVYALHMDLERAFGKLNQIHQNKGEIDGHQTHPTVE